METASYTDLRKLDKLSSNWRQKGRVADSNFKVDGILSALGV